MRTHRTPRTATHPRGPGTRAVGILSALTLSALAVPAVAVSALGGPAMAAPADGRAAPTGPSSPGRDSPTMAGRAAAQIGSQLVVSSLAVPATAPDPDPSVGLTFALSALPLPPLVTLVAPTVGLSTTWAAAGSGGVWAELRQCESGGNYATDTGNGYYGAYQFSEPTWLGIGETGFPNQASPAQQDAAAQRLQARSGWGQWPACSEKLGL